MITTKRIAMVLLLVLPGGTFALPNPADGLSIGGVVVNGTNGEPLYNVNDTIIAEYIGQLEPGLFITCPTDFQLQTGETTNSFYHSVDLSGCSVTDGTGGTYDIFGGISTTLIGSFNPIEVVEIIRLSRATPNSPISVLFEPFGFANLGVIEVTPLITDSSGAVLFSGGSVSATQVGIGPVGSPSYSVVLDGVPDDVVGANVNRILRLTLSAPGFANEIVEFPLTYAGTGTCVEILHVGPDEPAPAARNALFGCPTQLPPGNCLDKTTEAIAAARAYQKATRNVRNECGRKISADCESILQGQALAFDQLQIAQTDVQIYCGL